MNLRQVCFKAMLWSLAAAAGFGAMGMLVADAGSIWRVVVTALLAAIASGLMWPISMLVDRKVSRAAGLVGMAGVLTSFLIVLPAVWGIGSWEDEFLISASIVFWTTPVVMLGAWLIHTKLGRWSGWVGVVTCGMFVICMLTMVWSYSAGGRNRQLQENLSLTSVAVAGYGIAIACCVAGYGMDSRHWRWVGVMAAGSGFLWSMYCVWSGMYDGEKIFTLLSTLAVVMAHLNTMSLIELKGGQRWLRYATFFMVWFGAMLLDLAIVFEIMQHDFTLRLIGAAAIAASAGTLALIVLAMLNRRVEFELVESSFLEMTVVCPRCHKKQEIGLGDGKCKHCSLRISIRVEEPRCPECGYLLYKLTSDQCPECGASIESMISQG